MVVFNGTNFYAEAGGQTADEGKISCGENEMKIIDVQAEDGYVLHYGHMLKGEFKVTDIQKRSDGMEGRTYTCCTTDICSKGNSK